MVNRTCPLIASVKRSGVVLGPLPGFRPKPEKSQSNCGKVQQLYGYPRGKKRQHCKASLGGGRGGVRGERAHRPVGRATSFPSCPPPAFEILLFAGFRARAIGRAVGAIALPLPPGGCSLQVEEPGNTCHQHTSSAHGHREARATCQGLLPHLTFLCQALKGKIQGR